jgi:signal transduction histidine kinase/ligand-binding sensor domain-containing protein
MSRLANAAIVVSALVLTLSTGTAQAQYRFENWTTDNGLPQNGVRGVDQMPDGYLWFTTFDGLVRFDGVRFTVFDKSNTQGIYSNRFATLQIETDGTLLAGTEDGCLTSYRDGTFRSYTAAEGLPGNDVVGFGRDKDGQTFVLTDLGRFYFREGKFQPVADVALPGEGRFYLGPTGTLWTYDRNGVRQTSAHQAETTYPIKFNFDVRYRFTRLFEDSHGNLWINDQSAVYRLKDGVVKKFTAADGLPAVTIMPWVEDNDGSIWFSSSSGGFGAINYQDGRFTAWGKDAGFAADAINRMFKDREGSIWVVPADHGLSRIQKQIVKSLSSADGLAYDEAYQVLQTRNGDVYVGTTRGVSRLGNDGRFEDVLVKNPEGVNVFVGSLYEDPQGRLWVGSRRDVFLLQHGKLERLKLSVDTSVLAITADRFGNTWLGTDSGLFKFRDDKEIRRYTVQDGLPSDDIKVIREDHAGALWLGTYGGLARIDPQSERLAVTIYRTSDGLASNRVRAIQEDESGTLWIGTYDGGLSRFRDGRFFNFTVQNGLFNNGVFAILDDGRNNFWISCNRGIYRVSRQELDSAAAGRAVKVNSVAYGKQDGMLSTECNGGRQPSGIRTTDGRLWFPTQGGVAIVDPRRVVTNPAPPTVQIENVLIERQPIDLHSGVRLLANDHNLEIRYTGISFIKPEQVKFRYRIEGLAEEWTDVGTIREVYFPSLPAGDYTFHVIAANSDGVWNNEGARLKFRVQAPVWQRPWFIALLSLGAILIIFAVFRLREVELRRRQQVQQDFSRRLIDSQEQERKRIASELHDSLGQYLLVIKNWALFGLNSLPEQDPGREYLNEVSETTSLALGEVREIAHNLRPYQLERLGLTNALEYLLRSVTASGTIKFSSAVENIDGLLSKESEIIFYRVVQECLNNVVKHSGAAHAWITIKAGRDAIEFSCRDDGHGFNVDGAGNSLQSGFGLAGIAERVLILGGHHEINSEIDKGSIVLVKVPVDSPPSGRG